MSLSGDLSAPPAAAPMLFPKVWSHRATPAHPWASLTCSPWHHQGPPTGSGAHAALGPAIHTLLTDSFKNRGLEGKSSGFLGGAGRTQELSLAPAAQRRHHHSRAGSAPYKAAGSSGAWPGRDPASSPTAQPSPQTEWTGDDPEEDEVPSERRTASRGQGTGPGPDSGNTESSAAQAQASTALGREEQGGLCPQLPALLGLLCSHPQPTAAPECRPFQDHPASRAQNLRQALQSPPRPPAPAPQETPAGRQAVAPGRQAVAPGEVGRKSICSVLGSPRDP